MNNIKYKYYKNKIYNEYYRVYPDGILYDAYSIYPSKTTNHRKWRHQHFCSFKGIGWDVEEISEIDMFQICLDGGYLPFPDKFVIQAQTMGRSRRRQGLYRKN